MGNEVVNYQAKFAEMAQKAREVEKIPVGGGRFMSTKSGVLSFNGEPMPGNQVAVIILSSVFEHTYYERQWQPGNPDLPTCYALGLAEEGLGPHPAMQESPDVFQPQSPDCASCPMAEWGSSRTGRGKACQQRRRLYMIPAGFYSQAANGGWELDLVEDPQDLVTMAPALLKLPVTSTKNWSTYVHELSREFQRPPAGVVTRVSVQPDAKSQFQVHFDTVALVPNEFLGTVFALMENADKDNLRPYYVSEEGSE